MVLVLGIYIVGCSGPDEAADPAEVRQALEAKNQQMETYISQQNIDSLLTLYTPDAIFMPQGMEMVSGQDALRAAFQGMFDMGMNNIEFEVIEVESAGDIAYEMGRYSVEGPGGQPADRGKYIGIWKNVGGDWKLHRDIFNTDMAMPMDTTSMPADTTAVPADTTDI